MDNVVPARSVGDRLDRLPLTSFHRRLVVALAGMILFEWIETHSFAFAAPILREQWDLPISGLATVVAVSSLGAFTGGVLGGWLADRVGRRRTLLAFAVAYCLAALSATLVQSPEQLLVARTAVQFGAQGTAVVAIVVLSEFVPATARGRVQTYKVALGSLGIPIAAWSGYFLLPQWSWGWRLLFGLGACGAVFAVLVWRWVPESPRWLAAHGQTERAHEIVCTIERACGVQPSDPAPTRSPDGAGAGTGARPRVRAVSLITGAYRRRFLVVTALWTTGLLAYSAFTTWTPTLLKDNGLTLDDTLLLSAVLATAAPIGAIVAAPLIDRWDRRTTQLVLGVLSATVLLLFSVARSHAAILVFGFAVSLLFQMAVPFMQVYSAEVFPTRIRAVGSGTANALSRIVNFASPALVAAVYGGLGYTAVFALLAALAATGGCAVYLFGPHSTGVSLEDAASGGNTAPAPATRATRTDTAVENI
ncbi:MFS transporter [Streptomyces sp. R21]|uniref:MFS transporter n=1 Tax=Streptomyces sp. R21 TaxID=3238627 RepID=A0AB39P261_9ACTN